MIIKKTISTAILILLLINIGVVLFVYVDDMDATEGDILPLMFAAGTGTGADPYMVYDVHDLQNMSNDLAAHYALANDIDARVTREWNPWLGFEPVGDIDNSFTGTLDGRNHTITGLYIQRLREVNIGLFGYIGAGGEVRNVGVVDGEVRGFSNVGGLVGYNTGTVSNSYAMGNVSGGSSVGGLVGYNTGMVSNSYATGNVSGDGFVAGLVGWNRGGTVSNSYASGTVSGASSVGGLMGGNWYGTVSDSYATGNVSGHRNVGGLVGNNGGTVSNSFYNIDSVLINHGHHITIGGIFNEQYEDWFNNGLYLNIGDYADTLVPVDDYYEIKDTDGLRDMLGFADRGGYRFRLAADIDLSGEPGLYVPYLAAEFFGNNFTISNLHIDIPFAAHVGMFAYVNDGMILDLGLIDADVSGNDYVGGLVGNNCGAVDNSYAMGSMSGAGNNVGGLIGWNSGSVSNSYAMGNMSGTGNNVGGLVGWNDGTVFNSQAAGNVRGEQSVGGLVGKNGEGTVDNSSATCNVNGEQSVGGLVGGNDWGKVKTSYASGNVRGESTIGGLIGSNWGNVKNSYATGNVSGFSSIGGLLGGNSFSVENSFASGEVSGDWFIGGLVGYNSGTISDCRASGSVRGELYVGGLVGENSHTVYNSYATGNVNGESSVGGLVGSNYYTLANSYATGNVSGIEYVGGLLGNNIWLNFMVDNSTVENSYAIGIVTGEEKVGGLVGYNPLGGKIRNSFSDRQTTEYAEAIGQNNGTMENVRSLSTEEMKDTDTFATANWIIIDIPDENERNRRYRWNIVDGETYPLLNQGELESLPISNWHELDRMRYDLGGNYHLVNDLDRDTDGYLYFNDRGTSGWIPVGRSRAYFRGRLDGKNHTIIGLYINRPDMNNIGLFGLASDAVLTNIGLIDCDVTGNVSVGGLVGYNHGAWGRGTVSNSYAEGDVIGVENVGGLVGRNDGISSTVSQSYVVGTVRGNENVGGLVGYNHGWWGGCIVAGSYAVVNISGHENVGGLVGWNMGGSISDSYAIGTVSGNYDTGGLVGNNGLVGNIDNGGFIINTYAVVNVTGEVNTGGLIGHNPEGAQVGHSFVEQDISGQESAIGQNNGTVENVRSLSTEEMKDKRTYEEAGWDFENIWSMDEDRNHGYPHLQWQRYEEVNGHEDTYWLPVLILLVILISILLFFVLRDKERDTDEDLMEDEIADVRKRSDR